MRQIDLRMPTSFEAATLPFLPIGERGTFANQSCMKMVIGRGGIIYRYGSNIGQAAQSVREWVDYTYDRYHYQNEVIERLALLDATRQDLGTLETDIDPAKNRKKGTTIWNSACFRATFRVESDICCYVGDVAGMRFDVTSGKSHLEDGFRRADLSRVGGGSQLKLYYKDTAKLSLLEHPAFIAAMPREHMH
jgi:hypothetical protein